MTMSRSAIKRHTKLLNDAVKKAEKEFDKVYKATMKSVSDGMMDLDMGMDYLTDCLHAIATKYADACGLYTKELFERLAQEEYGRILEAELAPSPDIEDAENVVANAFSESVNDTYGSIIRDLDLMVKQTSRNTMSNAIKKHADTGVRFARIPQGKETCAFCLMLASRGFAYLSEWSAGLDESIDWNRYHYKCDCEVVPTWSDNPIVKGYEPEVYRAIYVAARRGVFQWERATSGEREELNRHESRRILSNIRDIGGSLVYDAHAEKEKPGEMTYDKRGEITGYKYKSSSSDTPTP